MSPPAVRAIGLSLFALIGMSVDQPGNFLSQLCTTCCRAASAVRGGLPAVLF